MLARAGALLLGTFAAAIVALPFDAGGTNAAARHARSAATTLGSATPFRLESTLGSDTGRHRCLAPTSGNAATRSGFQGI